MPVRKKIFFIDADVDFCTLMRTYCMRKNYEVFIAHNAQDAIQRLHQLMPDVIITSTALQDWEEVRKYAAHTAPQTKFLLFGIDLQQIRNL